MRPASDLSRINRARASSGDNGEEEPPVPIPNTEVKLFSAEDTWRETARENRTLPVLEKCNRLCEFIVLLKRKFHISVESPARQRRAFYAASAAG